LATVEKDRAVVVGQIAGSGFCEPALDRFLRHQAGSFSARAPTTYEYV
jgi:hypothetical protein